MSDYKGPVSEAENHPIVQTSGPDTPADWDMCIPYRIQAENYAERNGGSVDAAFQAIRAGAEDKSSYVRPRNEVIDQQSAADETDD